MRNFIRLFAAIVLICLIFYGYGRIRHVSDRLQVEQFDQFPTDVFDGTLHLATYNVAHGRGSAFGASNWSGTTAERTARLAAIGNYLKESEFDVVVLNEVDFAATWSGTVDQARLIAEAGEFPYLVRQKNYDLLLPGFTLQFGNAIVSKFPIKRAERMQLPALRWAERWAFGNHDAVHAVVDLDSAELSIVGLHLEVRSEETRVAAAEHLLATIDPDTILAGDFNSRPRLNAEQTAYDTLTLTDQFVSVPAPSSNHNTFLTDDPNRIIDWILVPSVWEVVESRVEQVGYSDHLPVSASVTYRGSKE